MELKNKLNIKIKEHEIEIEATLAEHAKLQTKLNKLQASNSKLFIQEMPKLMILKDKVNFHKAAVLTLKDILEDIK